MQEGDEEGGDVGGGGGGAPGAGAGYGEEGGRGREEVGVCGAVGGGGGGGPPAVGVTRRRRVSSHCSPSYTYQIHRQLQLSTTELFDPSNEKEDYKMYSKKLKR